MRLLFVFIFLLGVISCEEDNKKIDRKKTSIDLSDKPNDTTPILNDDSSVSKIKDTAIIEIKSHFNTSNINEDVAPEEYFHNVIPKRLYQLPKPLDTEIAHKAILKIIKEEDWNDPLGGTSEWEQWLYKETFRPIGWSKDGKFAFLINGIGAVEYVGLRIINSTTNKIIYDLFGADDFSVNEIWHFNYDTIEKALKENKIVQQYDFQLEIKNLPQIKLKDHWAEKEDLTFLKGTFGVLQNPFGLNAVTVDYYFWHDEGRGEGGTEFDVTGMKIN